MGNSTQLPASGVGPEGEFKVTCLGNKFTIRYVVNMRSGAEIKTVIETIRHFKHAIKQLASGNDEPASGVVERDGHRNTDYAMCNVWTLRSFAVVPYEGEIYKVPINICDELCSARQLIYDVWSAVGVMSDEVVKDDFVAAGNIISPAPQQEQSQKKTSSVLDEFFPRTEQSSGNNQPVNNQGVDIVYDRLSKVQREQLEADGVPSISLRCSAIEHEEVKYDNGDKVYRIVFWREDGEHTHSKSFAVKIDDREHNYDLKSLKSSGLFDLVPQPGYKVPVSGIAIFKSNKGKGQYEGRTFWNFQKFIRKNNTAIASVEEIPFDDEGALEF